ncbi:hypothetical protein LPB86_03940 [Pedobacter sp. MC2016-14]|uniref:hypothetical protein n=1 Tax=Pedobacter sp. MC2016-14 TaxID=2897327 RepID=UPI001E2AF050|nr:hypothetical protein [Pedobacter sp. MC2016-14]MCD0487366.1 hypothetical protein [Pedobacter sp. MC2016-14]
MEIDIKDIIDKYEIAETDLDARLEDLRAEVDDESSLWSKYEKLEKAFFTNHRVMSLFADTLQLVDSKETLTLYELDDVKRAYELLVKHNPDNLQYLQDLIYYNYVVLDDESESLALIQKMKDKLVKLNTFVDDLSRQISEA